MKLECPGKGAQHAVPPSDGRGRVDTCVECGWVTVVKGNNEDEAAWKRACKIVTVALDAWNFGDADWVYVDGRNIFNFASALERGEGGTGCLRIAEVVRARHDFDPWAYRKRQKIPAS